MTRSRLSRVRTTLLPNLGSSPFVLDTRPSRAGGDEDLWIAIGFPKLSPRWGCSDDTWVCGVRPRIRMRNGIGGASSGWRSIAVAGVPSVSGSMRRMSESQIRSTDRGCGLLLRSYMCC